MRPDSAARVDATGDGEVMAAVSEQRLVIADISCDDAWLSMPLPSTVAVDEYR